MSSTKRLIRRPAGRAARLAACAVLALLAGCGGAEQTADNGNPSRLPGGSSAPPKGASIALLNNTVFMRSRDEDSRKPLTAGRELQNGDTIETDETGQAELTFGTCLKIYIYQLSGLVKGSCPKFDAQLGNTYCAVEGTTAFKDCASNLTTQSDLAVVTLVGTWASHTYLGDRQLSVVLVFEGRVIARPMIGLQERRMSQERYEVPALHFWYTVPDDRLRAAARLVGLEPRRAYPFERLPEFLAAADLHNKSLDLVAEQAVKDGAAPESVLPYFRLRVPPVVGRPPVDGGRRPPAGPLPPFNPLSPFNPPPFNPPPFNPPAEQVADYAFPLTKVGRQSTRTFAADGQALVRPGSIRLTGADASAFNVRSLVTGAAPREVRQVEVSFNPATVRTHNARLSFVDTSGQPYAYRLSGSGAVPQLEYSASRLRFDAAKAADTLWVRATGRVPFKITSVSLKGDAANHFTIVRDDCTAVEVATRCGIIIAHKRNFADVQQPAIETAELIVEHDAPGAGKATRLEGAVSPLLEIAEGLPFGPVAVGGECERTLTLTNNSGQPLKLERAVVEGLHGSDFSIKENSCGTAMGRECRIVVNFRPGDRAAREAVLTVPYLAGAAPLPRRVRMSGTGTAPLLRFIGDGGFESRLVGTGTEERSFVLQRLSGPALQIKGFSLAGPNKYDFRLLQETCTRAPVEERCELRIAFEPRQEGPRVASLNVLGPGNTIISSVSLTPPGRRDGRSAVSLNVAGPGKSGSSSVSLAQPTSNSLPTSIAEVAQPSIAPDPQLASPSQAVGATPQPPPDPSLQPRAEIVAVTKTPAAVVSNTFSSGVPCADTYSLSLNGNGYLRWRVEPVNLCFGAKSVSKKQDAEPVIRQITVESDSRRPLTPVYKLEGEAAGDFRVEPHTCVGAVRPCTLKIHFTPRQTRRRSATLVLSPDATTPPVRVELLGRGQSGNPFKRFGRWFVGLFTDQSRKACRVSPSP